VWAQLAVNEAFERARAASPPPAPAAPPAPAPLVRDSAAGNALGPGGADIVAPRTVVEEVTKCECGLEFDSWGEWRSHYYDVHLQLE
jgi:hypothetical protein